MVVDDPGLRPQEPFRRVVGYVHSPLSELDLDGVEHGLLRAPGSTGRYRDVEVEAEAVPPRLCEEGAAAELPYRRLELPELGDKHVAVVSPQPHCRFGKLVPFHWSWPADAAGGPNRFRRGAFVALVTPCRRQAAASSRQL